jgi:hypothetical protein
MIYYKFSQQKFILESLINRKDYHKYFLKALRLECRLFRFVV